ncbi:MAG: hypothetical protein MI784_09810 [Cytophagales bacterium]|nr:hypothetical protein [Cytophagales bacterium]
MRNVTIIMAMEAEAKPIIEELKLQPAANPAPELPMRFFEGTLGQLQINLIVNGKDPRHGVDCIGTQPATLSAYLAFTHFNPDLVISAGTCGAFKNKGSRIADVYLSSEFKFHDRRISIPGFDVYGTGCYPSGEYDNIAEKLQLKKAVVSTGNSLDMSPTDFDIISQEEVVVKEMEAAAIAWVAEQFNRPLIALKSVTDLVDGEHLPQDEFLMNLEKASLALKEKTIAFLEALH